MPKVRKTASVRNIKPVPRKGRKAAPRKTKRIGLADYARHRGISERRVREVAKAGKITARKVKGRLTVDPRVADQEWLDNVDHKSRPRSLDEPALPDGFDAEAADLNVEINKDNAGVTRRIAEAKKEIWRAKQAELDYRREAAELVTMDRIQREAFEVARIVRDAVLVLPDRLSPELIGIRDQATMHAAMTKALNYALTELTNGIEKRFGVPARVCGGDEAGSPDDGQ